MVTEARAGGGAAEVLASGGLSGGYQLLFQRIYEEAIVAAREIADALGQRAEAPTYEAVQQRMVDQIESIAGDAVHLPPMHERRLALYVIVAMTDEVFLRSPPLAGWPGHEAWLGMPLEQQLFHTHSSGERVFDLLDDVLTSRTPLSRDLLAVFLTALALGFCGRYADGAQPEAYRLRLAEHLGYDAAQRIEDDARADTLLFKHEAKLVKERATLPSVMNGVYPILAVLAIWLVAGLGVWSVATYRLGEILNAIEAIR